MRFKISLVISLLELAVASFGQDPVKVFLLAGQSNMVGNCGDDQDPETSILKGPDADVQSKVFGTATYGWGPLVGGLGSISTVHGPELTFGHDVSTIYPGTNRVALIKGATSGTTLAVRWRPPSAGGTTGDLYANYIQTTHAALSLNFSRGQNQARLGAQGCRIIPLCKALCDNASRRLSPRFE